MHIRVSERNKRQVNRVLKQHSKDYLPWIVLALVAAVGLAGVAIAGLI